MNQIQISIVVPLYNEEAVFPELIARLDKLISNLSLNIEVVLIDDGSTDKTSSMMSQLALFNSHYSCVFLSRNYGHQIALSAGLQEAKGDEGVFIIDGDLQDPPELLPVFYKKMKEGFDVIYAIRKKRKESIIKRFAYYLFYRVQKKLIPFEIPIDSGDFSLLSRKVVNVLNKMPEESKYVRGLRAWIGLKQYGIAYERNERQAGKSKYSTGKLLKLAYNGIFNFTEIPVKFISFLGFIAIFISFIYLGITLFKRFFLGSVPEGFTGLLFAIILLVVFN